MMLHQALLTGRPIKREYDSFATVGGTAGFEFSNGERRSGFVLKSITEDKFFFLSESDILATDWEIINDKP
jgi:hypothetical protein